MDLNYYENGSTLILIIIEGQLQVCARFYSSNLVLKTVQNRFTALNNYENGSTVIVSFFIYIFVYSESGYKLASATWLKRGMYTVY